MKDPQPKPDDPCMNCGYNYQTHLDYELVTVFCKAYVVPTIPRLLQRIKDLERRLDEHIYDE